MSQALHIFRATALHLRGRIALVMLLVGLAAALRSRGASIGTAADLVEVLAFWFLIAGAVHDEPIPGNRQFWVTRPFRWQSLLGAKVLFVIAFVSFPALLADCAVLYRYGFSPFEDPAALLARHLLINLSLTIPPLALAAVTAGIGQFAAGAFTLAAIVVSNQYLGWMHSAIPHLAFSSSLVLTVLTAIMLAAVMIRQYAARTTTACRALLLLAVLIRLAPWTRDAVEGLLIQSEPGTTDAAVLTADPGRQPEWEGYSCFAIPIRLDADAEPVAAKVTVAATSFRWTSKWFGAASLVEHASGKWIKLCLDREDYDRIVAGGPVTLSATLMMAAWRGSTEVRVPFSKAPIRIPGFGNCLHGPFGLSCCTPLRPVPRATIVWEDRRLHLGKRELGGFHPPYEIPDGPDPVAKWFIPLRNDWRADFMPGPKTELVVSIRKDATIIRQQLNFQNVRLAR